MDYTMQQSILFLSPYYGIGWTWTLSLPTAILQSDPFHRLHYEIGGTVRWTPPLSTLVALSSDLSHSTVYTME